jgi:two-component system sensor histidine kinase DesK
MSEPTRTDPACPSRQRRWTPINLVWLCYSVYFFIQPAQQGTWHAWLEALLLLACFLALYLGASLLPSSRRTKQYLTVALTLFGIGAYRLNAGAGVVFIYVAALAPCVTDSFLIGGGIICAAAALAAAEGAALHYGIWNWGIIAFFAVPAGSSSLFWALRARTNARLTLAQEQIEHLAQVAERERIARDLHDVLGHTLSLIVLKSELAGRLIGTDPTRARGEIAEVEQTARRALAEVRETISGYRCEGLAAELTRARRTLELAGVRFECTEPPPRLAPLIESTLALIVRECVTNIVRHARAARCYLTIVTTPERTLLEISDDGRGGVGHEGNGLRGVRERLAALGGHVAIDSQQGTRLRVEIPALALASAS